jgi:hypothetical protein
MNNNILIGLIVLILIGVIYAGTCKTGSQRLCVVLIVLGIVLILCYVQLRSESFTGFGGYAGLDYTMGRKDGCDGLQYAQVNNDLAKVGGYDGIVLKSKLTTKPLVPNSNYIFFNNIGDGSPLGPALSSETYPSIDGTDKGEKSMFMLKYNQFSPDCCGSSPYSSDMGCLCLSEEQVNMFKTRGSNSNNPDSYPSM